MPEQYGEDYDGDESWAAYKDDMRSMGEEIGHARQMPTAIFARLLRP